jgi:ADP-heptose:LPS heptosyltransferase
VSDTKKKILVIKLGALGDFIQAASPFNAIRLHHRAEEITLLTSPSFMDIANASPWFDHVKIDQKPSALQITKWLSLRKWMRSSGFTRVYDLQTSDRSNFYHKMMKPANKLNPEPDWSGNARDCSHPHKNIHRDLMHTVERQKEQLHLAGIDNLPPVDLSWINADIRKFGLQNTFVLLVPGGAAHRPAKRWPGEYYQQLIQYFASKKIQVILIGGKEEISLLNELSTTDPICISLAGATNLFDLFSLARNSLVVIGNDTGPMHLAAVSGCKTIVLYSSESDPTLCAQRGDDVTIFRKNNLFDLNPTQIIKHLSEVLGCNQT